MQKPRFSKLKDWLSWQESLHGKEIDLGLERIRIVYERMGIEWGETRFITVGGTNGKGSTIAFLNEAYKASGYKVGQFTSPHFLRYNERIQINSQPIDEASLCDVFAAIDAARGDVSLSYFEFSTLAALFFFAQQQADVVLMEVGLGGRLDASNLIDADCSIVTSIGIDHRDWLGDSREEIGFEKAGIYRKGKPAICGDLGVPSTVPKHAEAIAAQWWGYGQQFSVEQADDSWNLCFGDKKVEHLPYPSMLAPIQLNNAACAVLAIQLLPLPVPQESISQAIRTAALQGRMQTLSSDSQYDVVVDVAHNEDAAKSIVSAVHKHYADRSVYLVLGMLADKEVAATLAVLQQLKPYYYLATPDSPRALSSTDLGLRVEKVGGDIVVVAKTVAEAYRQACQAAQQESSSSKALVLVVGSFFTVAEVMGLSDRAGV